MIATMRTAWVVLVAVGCNTGDGAESNSRAASGSAVVNGGVGATKSTAKLDLPRVDEPAHVMVMTGAHPAALVWVTRDGSVQVGAVGASWAGDIDQQDRIVVADGAWTAVLEAIVAGHGPGEADASEELARQGAKAVRQQAIDQARAAGILGAATMSPSPGDLDLPSAGRLPGAIGVPIDQISQFTPLVLTAPDGAASITVKTLMDTGGVLGVVHDGKLAVLDTVFVRFESPDRVGASPWLEVHTDTQGAHLILQPDAQEVVVPWKSHGLDRKELAKGFEQLRRNAPGHERRVDLLTTDGMTNQQLVDLVVAFSAIGTHELAVAVGPNTIDQRAAQLAIAQAASQAGGRIGVPNVAMGQPNAQGDLDKAIIRRYVKRNLQKIQYCYEKQLLVDAKLQGTVMVQFFITPDGNVATANASGVNRTVASCVADVIKAIEFPKPKGGGGVQVNYPFNFRPAGP